MSKMTFKGKNMIFQMSSSHRNRVERVWSIKVKELLKKEHKKCKIKIINYHSKVDKNKNLKTKIMKLNNSKIRISRKNQYKNKNELVYFIFWFVLLILNVVYTL